MRLRYSIAEVRPVVNRKIAMVAPAAYRDSSQDTSITDPPYFLYQNPLSVSILNSQFATLEDQTSVSIVAYRGLPTTYFFPLTSVIQNESNLRILGGHWLVFYVFNRQSTVTDTPPIGIKLGFGRTGFSVDCQAVFMAPEPENRPLNKLGELLSGP